MQAKIKIANIPTTATVIPAMAAPPRPLFPLPRTGELVAVGMPEASEEESVGVGKMDEESVREEGVAVGEV